MMDTYDWAALTERAEAGQLASVNGTTLRGEDAARSGRNALLHSTGGDSTEEAKHIALGGQRRRPVSPN